MSHLRVSTIAVFLLIAGFHPSAQAQSQSGDATKTEDVTTPAESPEADPLLAVINGKEMRESHIYEQIETLALGDQVEVRQAFTQFAESVVREEILYQSMIGTNFASEPELLEEVRQIVVNFLIKKHVTSKLAVSDEDVLEFYENNKRAIRGENLRASQIVRNSVEECNALMSQIKSEADFARLAEEQSLDEKSSTRGGDIGYMMPHAGGPFGFELELFDLQPDAMKVIQRDGRCHLIRVTEHEMPSMPALEDVKARVADVVQRQRQAKLLQQLLNDAQTRVTVERPAKP